MKKDPLSGMPLSDPDNYQRMFLNPVDNAENLTEDYIRSLANLPKRLRPRRSPSRWWRVHGVGCPASASVGGWLSSPPWGYQCLRRLH
jgi:hypothetical protein